MEQSRDVPEQVFRSDQSHTAAEYARDDCVMPWPPVFHPDQREGECQQQQKQRQEDKTLKDGNVLHSLHGTDAYSMGSSPAGNTAILRQCQHSTAVASGTAQQ